MSLTISPVRIVEESSSPLLAAPDAWPRRPLGEVATIINGFAFKSENFVAVGGRPLIRIRDIFADRTAVGYKGKYDDRYVVQPGELLIGMDGDFNCARWRGPQGLLNQRVCKIVPDSQQLDLDFLAYILPGYLQAIRELTSATTVTHLSSRDVAQIPIPVPHLDDQRALSRIFIGASSKQQSAYSHLQAASHMIQRFRQAVLAGACSGRLTADWRNTHTTIGLAAGLRADIEAARRSALGKRHVEASVDVDGSQELWEIPNDWVWTTPEQLRRPERFLTYGVIKLGDPVPDGVPTLRSSNVRWLRIDDKSVKRITKEIADKYQRTYLEGGEVLVTVRGSLGGVAVAPARMTGWNVSREVAVIPVVAKVHAPYIAYAIGSAQSQRWMASIAKGVTYTGVNIKDLKRLPLPLPCHEEQAEIARRIEQLFVWADGLDARIDAAIHRVERSPQAVLAKAFRGELTVARGRSG